MCGHKNLETKIDSRPFGFPFDRDIDFDIHNNHKLVDIFLETLKHIFLVLFMDQL